MFLSWFVCLLVFVQNEVPFKAKNEFEVKLNYAFKQRPPSSVTTFRYDATEQDQERQNGTNMLPYLELKVKILTTASEEVRVKVVNNLNNNAISKKIQDGSEFAIDMGFTDDVKDRVTAHEYIIYLQNDKRKEQSKIVIFVKEDGTFLINDEVRGKF